MNEHWTFYKYGDETRADSPFYDVRPDISGNSVPGIAGEKPAYTSRAGPPARKVHLRR